MKNKLEKVENSLVAMKDKLEKVKVLNKKQQSHINDHFVLE